MGLRCQESLAPIAYIASLEQTIPFFDGEKDVCPQLSYLVGQEELGEERRWDSLIASGCRTGQELKMAWDKLQTEARECASFLGEDLDGALAVSV